MGLAVADIGLEGCLVLERRGRAEGRGPELRPRRFQRELIDDGLVLVDRIVDAVELLDGEHVGRQALLDLADALIVRRLERLEGAHEVVEGDRPRRRRATAAPSLAALVSMSPIRVSSARMSSVKCCSLMSSSFWGPVFARCNAAMPGPSPVIRVSIVLAKMQMPATKRGHESAGNGDVFDESEEPYVPRSMIRSKSCF